MWKKLENPTNGESACWNNTSAAYLVSNVAGCTGRKMLCVQIEPAHAENRDQVDFAQ
jgi:hypothetical protein